MLECPRYRIQDTASSGCVEKEEFLDPISNAAVTALAASGLPSGEFLFAGFLPAKKNARRQKLTDLANIVCTLVFYEAPHRIETSLEDIQEIFGDREACVARELTKFYEEYLFGRLSDVRKRVKPLGEFVVVVAGNKEIQKKETPLSREDVLKKLGMTRNELYDLFFKKKSAG